MAVHEFNADFSIPPSHKQNIPFGLGETPSIRQIDHAEGGKHPFDGTDFLAYPHHLEEFLQPGFRSLDDAMKQYWSGIRVPTKDSYRFMRVKIAGGDKSILIWAGDLQEGRAKLPLAAISRGSHGFNPDKFSPPHHAMTARYLSTRGDLVAKVFRPVPFLVDYDLTIWAEHKKDAEYILFQILPRFNPIAEFRMSDGKLEGNVQLRYGGANDASDKEVGYDQQAKVRYEVSLTAEAWLPLPEKIVPAVLGRVTILKEQLGEVLYAAMGNQQWFKPEG